MVRDLPNLIEHGCWMGLWYEMRSRNETVNVLIIFGIRIFNIKKHFQINFRSITFIIIIGELKKLSMDPKLIHCSIWTYHSLQSRLYSESSSVQKQHQHLLSSSWICRSTWQLSAHSLHLQLLLISWRLLLSK